MGIVTSWLSVFAQPDFVIGTTLTLFFGFLSFYFYFKGKRIKEISFTVEKICLAKQDALIEGLTFQYKGKGYDSISVSDVIIWNSRNEVINKADIASLEPLSIWLPEDTEILDAQIIRMNQKCNQFEIALDQNMVRIKFEYIAPNEGVAARIIHTNTDKDAVVKGTIKGGKPVHNIGKRSGFFYRFVNLKWVKKILSSKFASFVIIFCTVIVFPHAFAQSSNYAMNNRFGFPKDSFFMNLDSVVIFLMCIVSVILAIPHIRNLFKREAPKELLKYTICEK